MAKSFYQKILILTGAFLAVWLGIRYLLPLLLPFLLGAALAFGAEPLVKFGQKKLRLPRAAASVAAVTMALSLLCAVVILLAALVVRELGVLSGVIPDLSDAVRQGLGVLQDRLLGLADRAPDGIRTVLIQGVTELFSGGSAFLDRLTSWLLGLATGILRLLPDGLLGLATTVLASYMLSFRLPALRQWLRKHLPQRWKEKYLPALGAMRSAVWGWLKAQVRLAGVTFAVTLAGFLLLGISYAPVWGLVVAVVDAVPLLGTGTVLIPWGIICFIQGETVQGVGLLALYAVAALARSCLEPRLVGKQLGLDPLVTLLALYAGYKVWGIGGMILSPMLAVTVTQAVRVKDGK